MSVTVIGEPGCTAEGDLTTILKLVDCAAYCGADVFKGQWTSDPREMCRRRNADDYLPFYEWIAYPQAWHEEIAAHCQTRGIRYACSVYIPGDAEKVAPYVSAIKIASFEGGHVPLCGEVYETGCEVWVSTGMMKQSQVDALYSWSCGMNKSRIAILQCTSSYPTPVDQLQFGVLRTVHTLYDGVSDHSEPALTLTGMVAASRGARVIEAHFKLASCDPTNPDAAVAMSPAEFTRYIKHIRFAEACLGDGEKKVQPCEQTMSTHRVTPHP